MLIRRALESVDGADENPFAVAVARFRLLVAALKAGGVRELSAAPGLPIRVAVADSLLRSGRRTGQRLDIKVPPKYTGADFLKHSYWSNRGKLDVPKERFISYPGASLESDSSLLLGWAGWNHRDQADALVGLIRNRVEDGGWDKKDPRLVPLLAGLREVLPWVHQWYGEYDEEWEGNPAEEFQAALESVRAEAELSETDLATWRPEKKTRGRQKKSE
ncbi:DUF7008 domain-containing protein [Streptomyces sp. NPDC002491]